MIRMICLLFCFCFTMDAAAPGTHMYFAQLWLEKNEAIYSDQETLFIAGTLFPDIRYLGTLEREETHEETSPEKICASSNAFQAGMRLHSYVDILRSYFIKKSGIKLHLNDISPKARVLFLKLLEDEILWDKINTCKAITSMEKLYPEEIATGAGESTIMEWHNLMTIAFQQPPSEFLKNLAKENKAFLTADPATIQEWSYLFPLYAKNPFFMEYVEEMTAYVSKTF